MQNTSLIFFLLILVVVPLKHADAQRNNPLRVELNANLEMEDYQLVPCGENGLLVFFESNNEGSAEDTRVWNFAMYNKNMQQQWLADTALIDGLKFLDHASDGQNTYLLFLDLDRLRSPYNMQILVLDYNSNVFRIINASVPDKSQPLDFIIKDRLAVIPLNHPAHETRIVLLKLDTEALKIITPEVEGLNIMQEVVYDADDDRWYFVLDNYLGKKKNALIILEANSSGTINRRFRLNPALDHKVLNEGRIASTSGDTLLVIGTYHGTAAKIKANDEDEGIESAGYFICKFVNEKQVYINYFNFLEFEDMYRSLSSRTIAELRRKAEKQKNNGEEYSLDYTLLLHNIIPFNNEYVILGEAYYPEYRTVTNMYYDYYGRPIPQTYTVFDGYKYFSGIAASFNAEGELNWDNGIEIENILTYNLQKHLGTYQSKNEMALFYSNENKIFYKMIGSEAEGQSTQNIRLEKRYKGDKLMEDMGSRMIHWYNNYFICYGYQKIKNNRISGGKRTIFYFSKLAFN